MKLMYRDILIFNSQLLLLLVQTFITSIFAEDDAKSPGQRIPITDFDWDIAVSHGNGATLMSASTSDSCEFTFPMPTLIPAANRFQPMDTFTVDATANIDSKSKSEKSTRRLTYDVLEGEWSNFEVMYLVFDASRNLLYFSHYNRNLKLTNLCVFNITSNETKLLLQTYSGSVDFLLLHDGDLYFIEENCLAIMKLNVSGIDFSLSQSQTQRSILPIVVMKFKDVQINGFTIDPKTGDLFWSSSKPGQNPSTIFYASITGNGLEEKVLLSTDLNHVHGLVISDSHVYFINTPHSGQRNKIERLSLTNSAEREVVVDFEKLNHNQLPFTLTIVCGVLYWTDTVYNAAWKLPFDRSLQDSTNPIPISRVFTSRNRNHDFSILAPYAISPRRSLDEAACISRNITQKTVFVEAPIPNADSSAINITLSASAQNLSSESEAHAASSPKVKFCEKEEGQTICLNGATCLYLDQMPFCLCPVGYAGQKCELDLEEQHVTNHSFLSQALDRVEDCTPTNSTLIIFTMILIGIIIALSIIIIILGIKVCRFSQKPKIRRRFIVARSENQGSSLPSVNVCEMIDIENCCNMDVCETPCYNTLTGQVSLENENHDKQRLIQY